MGMFLSLSGVVNKTRNDVVNSLTRYATSLEGELLPETLATNEDNCCVIEEHGGSTTVLYPHNYLNWDNSSQFISKNLNASVFSFHIHDGDLWMYILYRNGEVVDQFNPVPDYWDDDIDEEEINSWKGDSRAVVSCVTAVKPEDINKYLAKWDLESDVNIKAYPDDEYGYEDWQLLDFMRKLRLPYPIDDSGNPKGQTYSFWTKE